MEEEEWLMIQVRRIRPLLLLQAVLLLLLFCMPQAALRGASSPASDWNTSSTEAR